MLGVYRAVFFGGYAFVLLNTYQVCKKSGTVCQISKNAPIMWYPSRGKKVPVSIHRTRAAVYSAAAHSQLIILRAQGYRPCRQVALTGDCKPTTVRDHSRYPSRQERTAGSCKFPMECTMLCTRYVARVYYACLLYTSPSPRDKRQSRMPSSA